MTLKPKMAAGGEGRRDAGQHSRAAANSDTFVINLCSSTTPMALAHPHTPELKRFRFFVSRRLEDGRERFRLHMGYFETLLEAEEWLSVVRDIYPGAWAGETPGKRLRARDGATAPPPASPPAPAATMALLEESVASVADLPSAPPTATTAPPSTIALEPVASPAAITLPALAPEIAPAPPALELAPEPAARERQAIAPAPLVAAQRQSAPARSRNAAAGSAARPAKSAPLAPLSNVREVLAALDEPETALPKPSATRAPRGSATPSLSDTQVMQMLEERRSGTRAKGEVDEAPGGIAMLRPDDTGTRRALKEAVQKDAAVSFSVQLQWSVQPMELDKVPPLAIFSAYTLYTVEGSREGRKWYGLRLGFFTDAVAAKQVAQYVRSDFTSVAVVPVSAQERERASSADHKIHAASFAQSRPSSQPAEIELLDDEALGARAPLPATTMRGAAKLPSGGAKTASPAARAAASRSKKLRAKERVVAERKGPYSLEETLEILGAGSLEIDNGRGELINETGAHHTHVEVRKNSPFARLVARLTERVRRS
jgi:hypothetical protein